jgi:hypothetical protein
LKLRAPYALMYRSSLEACHILLLYVLPWLGKKVMSPPLILHPMEVKLANGKYI